MTFATWSQTAASNTAVGGISTDGNVTLVNQIDNMFRGMMAELAVARDDGTIKATGGRGYLHGLTLSNNVSDATNDIDIAVGECAAENSPYWKIALASALTKRLDAAWAVGTGNGGLDTGAIANTTYHVWLIQRSDTLVVDALFSASATSPTMPANYDRKRRVGSILRESAVIVPFSQNGNTFQRITPLVQYTVTTTTTSQLRAFNVPTGIIVAPIISWSVVGDTSSVMAGSLGSAAVGVANLTIITTGSTGVSSREVNLVPPIFFTNTSAQIYHLQVVSAGTLSASNVINHGWTDTRGRDA